MLDWREGGREERAGRVAQVPTDLLPYAYQQAFSRHFKALPYTLLQLQTLLLLPIQGLVCVLCCVLCVCVLCVLCVVCVCCVVCCV